MPRSDAPHAPQEGGEPLVSVGIPTFNRLPMLRRAAESVLAQDYANLELVICDNASTDETQTWCETLAARDSRVRYFRQAINVGATANFNDVFARSRGRLYMVLGDDDWLGPSYVSRCAETLLSKPDLAVVCGEPHMFLEDQFLYQGRKMNMLQESAAHRVAAYLWQVGENVPFHGLMRREVAAALPPLREVLAGDWLFVASLAFIGKIRTLDNTWINKSVAGTTGSWAKLLRWTRLPPFSAKIPYLIITGTVVKEIAWGSPAYASAGRLGRIQIAWLATVALLAKFAVWSVAVVAKWLWSRFTSRPFPLRAR